VITRGDLLSIERLRLIGRFNLGCHDDLLTRFRPARSRSIAFGEVAHPLPAGTPAGDPRCQALADRALVITDVAEAAGSRIEISIDHNDQYLLEFFASEGLRVEDTIQDRSISGGGLRVDTITLPPDLQGVGLDSIVLRGLGGDERYYLGHLRFLPESAFPEHSPRRPVGAD
jgi:hypothetical protein